ncbi:MAG: polysaccharide pyruvyl transferase family protein [Tannerella sp.]|jgi:polysaccharide pyruvyl transferase WcaK-like protein|nr:polysaccharide pyruvyl transferase family protein [Tannerella sp.]
MQRRTFIKQIGTGAAATWLLPEIPSFATRKKQPVILLVSSWQTFNIGDIAHTPGVLAVFGQLLPGVKIILWPHDVGNGVKEILARRFPEVAVVQSEDEVKAAITEADVLVHGSGPSLVGRRNIARWIETTDKPFGIYGITFPGKYVARNVPLTASETDTAILNKASFLFFRDSVSLDFARTHSIACPIMEFGPDGTFACDLHNDDAATSFMKEHELEEGRFMCCIPRYRYTEEWLAKGKNRPYVQDHVDINNKMKDHDNAPLREAVTTVVRKTGMKILLCPEDETQVALGKTLILDHLPADVKAHVVWRDRYWLTDEAVSTYRRSAGLFGLEMHSPIICIGQGIPAVVCRFYEQSTKGFMWRDIGLDEWLFDMDIPEEASRVAPTVLSIAENQEEAKEKALNAQAFVKQRQRETINILKQFL